MNTLRTITTVIAFIAIFLIIVNILLTLLMRLEVRLAKIKRRKANNEFRRAMVEYDRSIYRMKQRVKECWEMGEVKLAESLQDALDEMRRTRDEVMERVGNKIARQK